MSLASFSYQHSTWGYSAEYFTKDHQYLNNFNVLRPSVHLEMNDYSSQQVMSLEDYTFPRFQEHLPFKAAINFTKGTTVFCNIIRRSNYSCNFFSFTESSHVQDTFFALFFP